MLTPKLSFSDSTFDEAFELGYDTLQLKYDGWYTEHICVAGIDTVFSETGRELGRWPIHHRIYGNFIAEYMFGTQWAQDPSRKGKVFLHDCYEFEGNTLRDVSYTNRYNALLINRHLFPKNFEIITCVPLVNYHHVWDAYVVHDTYEGVIFRKSFGKLHEPVLREKLVITFDGRVVGFEPGKPEGKYANTLGALVVCTKAGKEIRIGGGFTDAQRDEIWHSPEKFIHRWCEGKCNRIFDSGATRHANFVRWREDKDS